MSCKIWMLAKDRITFVFAFNFRFLTLCRSQNTYYLFLFIFILAWHNFRQSHFPRYFFYSGKYFSFWPGSGWPAARVRCSRWVGIRCRTVDCSADGLRRICSHSRHTKCHRCLSTSSWIRENFHVINKFIYIAIAKQEHTITFKILNAFPPFDILLKLP